MSLKLEELIKKSKKIVFFTGAGISTNSEYRILEALKEYGKVLLQYIFKILFLQKKKRVESWRRKFGNELSIDSATPNEGHKKIAEIMKVKDSFLITQNVDNLHQNSGVEADKISELHGNATYAKCLDCNKRYELEALKKEFLKQTNLLCALYARDHKNSNYIFWPGYARKGNANLSKEAAIESDLFICIGTSLAVFPASRFTTIG